MNHSVTVPLVGRVRLVALVWACTLLVVLTGGLVFLTGGLAQAQDNSPISFPENGTGAVATFTATDPEGKTVMWSVAAANTDFSAVEGIEAADAADAAHFEIDDKTGVLAFMAEDGPDFEMPRGQAIATGNTNEYKVVIAASDGAQTSYHAVTVEVQNEDEDATTKIELTSLQPRDGVDITVAYVDGVGNPFVDSNGTANGAIVDPDGSKADTTATTIPDTDVTWQWSKSTTRTGTFTDIPGAAAKIYTPDAGDVNRYLRLTATYEDGQGAGKTVMATSAYPVLSSRSTNSNPAFPNDFDPTTDGNQEPAAMLDDGATAGDNVGDPITASDAEGDRLTYSFDTTSTSADLDVFQIDRATGQVTVGLGKTVSPAGDTGEPGTVTKQATFTVTIKATDSHGDSDTATLTITMKETDEAPVFTLGKLSHEHAENTDPGTPVYTFAAYDPEGASVTYAVSGADASKFSITAGGAGELTFLASPDFEAPGSADSNNVYRLTVKASDASTPAKSTSIDVTVTVTNVDEPGTVSLSASAPRIGVEIRANTPVDPDGGVTGVTWQWAIGLQADGSDAANIKGATMAAYTPVAADDVKYLRVTATYTDNEGSGKTVVASPTDSNVNVDPAVGNVTVKKVRNLAPAFTDEDTDTPGIQINPRAVPENSAAATAVTDPEAADPSAPAPVVATDNADDDGTDDNSILYILGGADAASFEIADPNSDTGAQIRVKAGAKLDHETKDTYVVTVTARDPEGANSSVDVTINVTDVDEGPEIIRGGLAISGPLSPRQAEGATGAVATYTLVGPNAASGRWVLGGADAGDFTFAGGVLTFAATPDYEAPTDANTDNVYEVTLSASDGTYMAERDVRITVTNVDEDGELTLSLATPAVDVPLTATLVDPDVVHSAAWQWALEQSDGSYEDIAGETSDTYTPVAADEGSRLQVTVTYTDGHGAGKRLQETSDSAVVAGDPLLVRYDADGSGEIEKGEVITAINDYLDEGVGAPTKGDVIRLINLYLDA